MTNFRELFEVEVSNSTERDEYKSSLPASAKKVKDLEQYSLYKNKSVYFLVDNDYIAHVDVTVDKINGKRSLFINSAYSAQRGAYKTLLRGILSLSNVRYIISDALVSSDALSFWKKILKDTSITKIVLRYNEEIVFEQKQFTNEQIKMILSDPDITIGMK